MVKSPQFREQLRRLSVIVTGSAPLSTPKGSSIGDDGGPRVQNFYGNTENWPQPICQHRDDFRYLRFHETSGVAMLAVEGGDLSELVIVRSKASDSFQAVFKSFPKLQSFHIRDLFSRHPHDPEYWKYEMRADDVVKLSNGQSLHSSRITDLEQQLQSHPSVRRALYGGTHRPAAFLLLELTGCPTARSVEDVSGLWPLIEEINEGLDFVWRLDCRLVVLSSLSFDLLAKGTIRRKNTIEKFRPEIEAAFASLEQQGEDVIPYYRLPKAN